MLTNDPAASPLNDHVPPSLHALILSMLAKNPVLRPSAAEVARTLDDIMLAIREPKQTEVSRQPQLWAAT